MLPRANVPLEAGKSDSASQRLGIPAAPCLFGEGIFETGNVVDNNETNSETWKKIRDDHRFPNPSSKQARNLQEKQDSVS